MRSIEFHNREKEINEIRNKLNTDPTLITFIYGPINSGKTELINQLIKQLPEEYVVFYINLRTKLLASYDKFVESLFELEIGEKRRKETLKELVSSVTKVAGIPITREFLDYVFKDKKPKNAFSYIIKLFEVVNRLKLVKELGDEITIGGRPFDVHYEKLVNVLKTFVSRDEVGMNEVDEVSKRYLVKDNILFLDPLRKMMKPQSNLNLRAIREVMKET